MDGEKEESWDATTWKEGRTASSTSDKEIWGKSGGGGGGGGAGGKHDAPSDSSLHL